jgi:DHA1 family bicyclomycin/chloramphenicol resistance-like MFS transporter
MIGPQSRIFVVLLGALMMVNVLSIDMTLPALPALGAAFSAGPDQIQLTLSLYLLGYAAGQIVIGPLSDRFGRRRVLVGGLAVYSLATLACAASPASVSSSRRVSFRVSPPVAGQSWCGRSCATISRATAPRK